MIADETVEQSILRIENAAKNCECFSVRDDISIIKQAFIEKDRKIYGLKQTNKNLEEKLVRIGGYHYGNPKW